MLSDRLLYELALLQDYKEKHEYLLDYEIEDDDVLKISFSLSVKEHKYDFKAIFNRYFPYQPIEILALTKFYTSHQYKNGAMCLQWGQDNWNSKITFIDLLDNLYDLLEKENPLGDEHSETLSGDSFTFGQQIRRNNSPHVILPIDPNSFKEKEGIIYFSTCNAGNDIFVCKINDIEYCVNSNPHSAKYLISPESYNEEKDDIVRNTLQLGKKDIGIVFFKNCAAVYATKTVLVGSYLVKSYEVGKRISISDDILHKKITIIGLGSIGSIVADNLARAGFDNFYLVDDDVFMPYNIVRHELASDDFGSFKTTAIKNFIQSKINKKAKIDVSLLAMVGQESSTSTNNFLTNCEDSSIIIDCTACESILYILNEMTKEKKIPVLSGTVISGGFGNIILAKKSNGIDIISILTSYYNYQDKQDFFAKKGHDYESSSNEQIYTATMSDCSILGGLMGKIAIYFLEGKEDVVSEINIFSTSEYGDLKCFYKTFSLNAHPLDLEEENFDEELLEKGKNVYESFCTKRDKQ